MKRLLFVMVGTVCAALLFATGGAEDKEDGVTLTFSQFWVTGETDDGSGEVVQARLDAFAEENPDVTVTPEFMAHDEYYDKFRVWASADELPDVFIMNADMTTPLSQGGLLLDITDAYNADTEWSSLINTGLLTEWSRGGRIYGLPAQVIMTHQIFHNTEMLSQVGFDAFPNTWEGVREMVVALREAGHIPIAVGAKAGWPLSDCLFGTLIFRATGVDWYNDLLEHDAAFTDPEFVLALELFADLVELGAFNADATSLDNMQAQALYFNRDAAMFVEGGWAIAGGLQQQDVEAVTEIALWPAVPGGKGAPNEVCWASGWGWSASSKLEGRAEEAAIGLMRNLSDEEYGRMRIERGLGIAQAVSDYDASSLPRLFVKEQEMAKGWQAVPVFQLGLPSSTTDVYVNALQEIMTGQTTPDEAAAEIQADYEQTM